MVSMIELTKVASSPSFQQKIGTEIIVAYRDGATVYVAWDTAFRHLTSAEIFLLLIEAGALKDAVEFKERYGICSREEVYPS